MLLLLIENVRRIFTEIDKNRQMQLRAFFRRHSKKATPIAVHIFMLLGVSLYTIFGALIMQRIESQTPVHLSKQRSEAVREQQRHSTIGRREIAVISRESHSAEHHHKIRHLAKIQQKYPTIVVIPECIAHVIETLADSSECNSTFVRKQLEECYYQQQQQMPSSGENDKYNSQEETQPKRFSPRFGWSFTDSVLFCFTVITTIGYGNVAPKTFSGQLFCILYALIGIPFTLLAIADLGKFLSEILESWEHVYLRILKKIARFWRQLRGRPKFSFVSTIADCSEDRKISRNTLLMNINNSNLDPNNNLPATPVSPTTPMSSLMLPPSKKMTPTIVLPDDQQRADLLDAAERGQLLPKLSVTDRQQRPNALPDGKEADEKDNIKSNQNNNNEDTSSEKSEHFEHTQAIPLLIFFLIYVLAGACLLSAYEPDMHLFKAIYFNFVSLTSIGLGDVVPQSETYMALTLLYIAVGLALTTIAIEIAADYLKKLHYFGRKIENVGNVVIWFGGKKLTMKQLVKNLGDQFNLPVHQVKTLDLDKFVDDAIKVEEGELNTLRPAPIVPRDLLEEGTLNFADDDTEIEEWIRQKTPSTPSEPPEQPNQLLFSPLGPKPEIISEPDEQPSEPADEPVLEAEPSIESEREMSAETEKESEHEPEKEEEPNKEEKPMEAEEKEEEKELPMPLDEVKVPDIKVVVDEEIIAPKIMDEEDPETIGTSVGTISPDMERRKSNYSEEAWRRYLEYKKQWRKFRHTRASSASPSTTSTTTSSSSKRPSGQKQQIQMDSSPRQRPSSSLDLRDAKKEDNIATSSADEQKRRAQQKASAKRKN